MPDLIDRQTDRHAWFDGQMDMPDLMNLQTCLIWYQTFTGAVHRCVLSLLYVKLTDFQNSVDWQTWLIWWTCLIWWTKRHAWFDGQTDIPDLMDRWTCLIWWTHSAWFDTDLVISLKHSPERYIDASFPPYMMDWRTSLIQWTDGHAWFDGLIDMPDLIDWRTYYPYCHHFRRCCGYSGRCVVVVVAAIDYNLICIL